MRPTLPTSLSGSAARLPATTRSTPAFWSEAGIDSVSVTPDAFFDVNRRIAEAEAG
jgi:phosphoenolpyruvate synthase/pyruvate phosphate dikinase